jgi:hypothetical protein
MDMLKALSGHPVLSAAPAKLRPAEYDERLNPLLSQKVIIREQQ